MEKKFNLIPNRKYLIAIFIILLSFYLGYQYSKYQYNFYISAGKNWYSEKEFYHTFKKDISDSVEIRCLNKPQEKISGKNLNTYIVENNILNKFGIKTKNMNIRFYEDDFNPNGAYVGEYDFLIEKICSLNSADGHLTESAFSDKSQINFEVSMITPLQKCLRKLNDPLGIGFDTELKDKEAEERNNCYLNFPKTQQDINNPLGI